MTYRTNHYKSRIKNFERKFLKDCKKNFIKVSFIDIGAFMYNHKFDRLATEDEIVKSDSNIKSLCTKSQKILPTHYDEWLEENKFKSIFVKKEYNGLFFNESSMIDLNTNQIVYHYMLRFAIGKDCKNYWALERIKKLQ
jgi:hypothetical protein